MRPIVLLAMLLSTPLLAAEAVPEIQRAAGTAQATGALHTLRQIPEACARLEGRFTGDTARPYDFAVTRTSATCQPRARFVDAAKVRPSVESGWKLNDVIRVPGAACPGQQAVVTVWRKPTGVALPKPDGQGQSRIYLEESRQQAADNKLAAIPMYAAVLAVEGKACGG